MEEMRLLLKLLLLLLLLLLSHRCCNHLFASKIHESFQQLGRLREILTQQLDHAVDVWRGRRWRVR